MLHGPHMAGRLSGKKQQKPRFRGEANCRAFDEFSYQRRMADLSYLRGVGA